MSRETKAWLLVIFLFILWDAGRFDDEIDAIQHAGHQAKCGAMRIVSGNAWHCKPTPDPKPVE